MTNLSSKETNLSEYFYTLYSESIISWYGSDDAIRWLNLLLEGYMPVEEFFRLRNRAVSRQRLHQLEKEGRIDTIRILGRLWIADKGGGLPMKPWQKLKKAPHRDINHQTIIATLETEVARLRAIRQVALIVFMMRRSHLQRLIEKHRQHLS